MIIINKKYNKNIKIKNNTKNKNINNNNKIKNNIINKNR
jgi:hypothetical protein